MKHLASTTRLFASVALMAIASPFIGVQQAQAYSGAIFTTDGACAGTNVNLFANKVDVYLDGGPHHPGSAALPPGNYWVKVEAPGGTLLGVSPAAVFVVGSDGAAVQCYHLTEILNTASTGTPGFDDTTNGGGEYKVTIATTSAFSPGDTKSDNFKVGTHDNEQTPPTTHLAGLKFYDTNLNGVKDSGEVGIAGVVIQVNMTNDPDGVPVLATTDSNGDWSTDLVAELGVPFAVSEVLPATGQANYTWIQTAPQANGLGQRVYNGTTDGTNTTYTHLDFGDACIHPLTGGFTLGFWSNKNGQAILQANDAAWRAKMNSSSLRDAKGNLFTLSTTGSFSTVYTCFRNWLLSANATNMAYMLSAQLAATTNDVNFKGLDGTQILQLTPELAAAYGGNVAVINDVIAQAKASLATNGNTVQASATRTLQECLKNILDGVNNNAFNVVSSSPCDVVYVQ